MLLALVTRTWSASESPVKPTSQAFQSGFGAPFTTVAKRTNFKLGHHYFGGMIPKPTYVGPNSMGGSSVALQPDCPETDGRDVRLRQPRRGLRTMSAMS